MDAKGIASRQAGLIARLVALGVACALTLALGLALPGKALAEDVPGDQLTGVSIDAETVLAAKDAPDEQLADPSIDAEAPLAAEDKSNEQLADTSLDTGDALAVEDEPAATPDADVMQEASPLADNSRTVYVSRTGTKYHYSSDCSSMKNPRTMTLGAALSKGYTACAKCVHESSGGGTGPETDVSSSVLTRLFGPIALDTMKAITTEGFASGSCPTVVLATTGGYWDALTASSLAGLYQSPVLLTDGNALSAQTAAEIKRLGASKVLVAGGPAAVSDKVLGDIRALGSIETVRFAGDTATGTAAKIFYASDGWGDTAIVATSNSFHDALSIAPYAYAKKAPIFLSEANGGKLSNETLKAVQAGGFRRVYIVGGTAAVPSAVERQLGSLYADRLSGATAYETSEAIARWCVGQGMQANYLGVATGNDYYDALAGAALCGKNNAALVLVSDNNRETVNGFIASYASGVDTAYVFGGPAAVSPNTFNAIADIVS